MSSIFAHILGCEYGKIYQCICCTYIIIIIRGHTSSIHWCALTAICVPRGLVSTITSPTAARLGLREEKVCIIMFDVHNLSSLISAGIWFEVTYFTFDEHFCFPMLLQPRFKSERWYILHLNHDNVPIRIYSTSTASSKQRKHCSSMPQLHGYSTTHTSSLITRFLTARSQDTFSMKRHFFQDGHTKGAMKGYITVNIK